MTDKPPRLSLYDHFNRFLERHLPEGLYPRSLIIVIAPIVVLQILMAGMVLDRHWDQVTRALGRSLAKEVGLLVTLYDQSDKSPASLAKIDALAESKLSLAFDIVRGEPLPPPIQRWLYSFADVKLTQYLVRETKRPVWLNTTAPNDKVDIRVELEKGVVLFVQTEQTRAYAANTYLLLSVMLISALLILFIAVRFLRNQINPIVDLANAAQAFGLGRDMPNFVPRGAQEVQRAGHSIIEMRRRLGRFVEQRTAMLAGVSHDLRTILTRFKLGLAVLGDNAKTKPLQEDVAEMQHMLEDYMAFVRGDGGEQTETVAVAEAVQSVAQSAERNGSRVEVRDVPDITTALKPVSFRRLMTNIVTNATRYGKQVQISGEVRDRRLWLFVDDDGPGIPEAQRDDAFRPFFRLDTARNLDATGTGLGLAIALDIAHAHGGDIALGDSPMGGLRVSVKLPI